MIKQINSIKNVGGDSAQANISNGQIENIEMLYPTNNLILEFNRICKPIIETVLNKNKRKPKANGTKSVVAF